jgi:dihydroxyacetone kinase
MAGFSISLLRLNSQRKADLDYPVRASAWSQSGKIPSCRQVIAAAASELDSKSNQRPALANLKKLALNVADALAGAEQLLTDLDSATGDGDLGMSMCRGAQAIRNLPESAFCGEIELLTALGAALGKTIAGSSGPFYATALYRAARHLATQEQISDQTLAEAFNLAVAAISNLGGAKMGDRTMLDALQPAAEALSAGVSRGLPLSEAWTKAVNAGEDGAKKTAQMLPKLGRASYLGERALGHYDAGAMAVVVWLKALAK